MNGIQILLLALASAWVASYGVTPLFQVVFKMMETRNKDRRASENAAPVDQKIEHGSATPESHDEQSDAPRIQTVMIPTDRIRDLVGEGGATIRSIVEHSGAKIDVDETGRVSIASSDAGNIKKALAMISDITQVPEVGKTYLGKVVRLAEFGAFVELFPGTDGLLHISEIAKNRVKDITKVLRVDDQVMVKVLSIEGNRVMLSRKALIREQKPRLNILFGGEAKKDEGVIDAEYIDIEDKK